MEKVDNITKTSKDIEKHLRELVDLEVDDAFWRGHVEGCEDSYKEIEDSFIDTDELSDWLFHYDDEMSREKLGEELINRLMEDFYVIPKSVYDYMKKN